MRKRNMDKTTNPSVTENTYAVISKPYAPVSKLTKTMVIAVTLVLTINFTRTMVPTMSNFVNPSIDNINVDASEQQDALRLPLKEETEGTSKLIAFQNPLSSSLSSRKNVLVLGGAGFIGMHVTRRLVGLGNSAVVLDSLQSSYYSPALQHERVKVLHDLNIPVITGDICDAALLQRAVLEHDITHVIHLASQASKGSNVEKDQSQERVPPHLFEYPPNNVDCFASVLDVLRTNDVRLVYASSVHLDQIEAPDNEDVVVHPKAYHATTKRTDEMLAQAYYSLYGISSIGLRFPTVYGPYGRPDMWAYRLIHNVLHDEPISIPTATVFNNGKEEEEEDKAPAEMERSFMYIDDVAQGIISSMDMLVENAQIVTLGRDCSSPISELIRTVEEATNKKAVTKTLALKTSSHQEEHFGSMNKQRCSIGTNGETSIAVGMKHFVDWYISENGERFLPSYQEKGKKTTDLTTMTEAPPPRPATDICFVTASFAEEDSKADKVPSVSHLDHSAHRYFFFTNLPTLECDGWERILVTKFPFRRLITQSRWPKFMAWKHPAVSTCKAIIYHDAFWRPRDLSPNIWDSLVNITLASEAGIMQQIRPFDHSALQEMKFIKNHKKDISKNINASKKWFLSQPDFNNTSVSYRNNAFVYDPTNERFRKLMTAFWAHYSQEEDMWRDQPLYRYLVNKFGLKPELYPDNKEVKHFFEQKGVKGHNGHHYSVKDDGIKNDSKDK